MMKSYLAYTPLQIGDVDLMDSGVFRQVDLSPAVLLTELPDSLADLDADIRGHSPSIDLVQALYLVDALFHCLCASDCAKQTGLDRSETSLEGNRRKRSGWLIEAIKIWRIRSLARHVAAWAVFCLKHLGESHD
jgi:hypothetical protein